MNSPPGPARAPSAWRVGSRRGNRRCRCRRRRRRRRPSPAPRRRRRRRSPRRSASRSARYISPVSAFFFSGRFSVATSTPPSRSIVDRSCDLLQARLRAPRAPRRPSSTVSASPGATGSSFSAKKRASATRPRVAARRQAPPWRDRRRRARARTAEIGVGAGERGVRIVARARQEIGGRALQRVGGLAEPRARSRRTPRRSAADVGRDRADARRSRARPPRRPTAAACASRGRSPGCRSCPRRSRRCARRA